MNAPRKDMTVPHTELRPVPIPWSPEREAAFLRAVEEVGSVMRAAEVVDGKPGTHTTYYNRIRRHPEFKQAVDEALIRCGDKLRGHMLDLAMNGTKEPVFQMGKRMKDEEGKPASIRKFDSKIMALLVKSAKLMDKEFDSRSSVEVTDLTRQGALTLELSEIMRLPADMRTQLMGILKRLQTMRFGADTATVDAIEGEMVDITPTDDEPEEWELIGQEKETADE